MSSTDQTHKEYLAHQNGVVYWPFTAWDAILGTPEYLVDENALKTFIATISKQNLSGYLTQSALNDYVVKGQLPDFTKFALKTDLPTFDPNTVYTKDEVNAAIVKAIGDLQDKIYGGDVNAALDTIKELQDAYNGSNTIIQRLLTQVANKANVGDSYLKKEEDARFAAKSDIPDITPLAKQVDLSLVEQYGLPRNYWIVKNQTNGYSMDSSGNPTVANVDAQTTELIKYDPTIQPVFVGWGAFKGKQTTVAYYDANKNYISSTIWTVTSDTTNNNPHTAIEFYKYAASGAAYIRINCNFGANVKVMLVSSIFENADWTPALEDLKTDTIDLSNYYDKGTLDNKLNAKMDVPVVQYPRRETIDLTTKSIGIGGDDWNIHAANMEIVQYSETEGALDFNMVADDGYAQNAWETKNDMLEISFYDFWDLTVSGNHYNDSNNGFSCLTDSGVPFSTFVSSYRTGHMKIGFKTFATPIAASDWRMINMHVPLRKG